jgi:hypothetical protein
MSRVNPQGEGVHRSRWFSSALAASVGFVFLTGAAYAGVIALARAGGSFAGNWQAILQVALFPLLYVLPFVGAVAVYHAIHRHVPLISGETHCGNCGYMLRGLSEPRCPECGRSV